MLKSLKLAGLVLLGHNSSQYAANQLSTKNNTLT